MSLLKIFNSPSSDHRLVQFPNGFVCIEQTLTGERLGGFLMMAPEKEKIEQVYWINEDKQALVSLVLKDTKGCQPRLWLFDLQKDAAVSYVGLILPQGYRITRKIYTHPQNLGLLIPAMDSSRNLVFLKGKIELEKITVDLTPFVLDQPQVRFVDPDDVLASPKGHFEVMALVGRKPTKISINP